MDISSAAALWYLPFALPICLYVAYTDLAEMKIKNIAVLILAGGFLVLGLLTLPLPDFGLRLVQGAVVLAIGIALNAIGAMGAGDAKFLAAAAPYVAPGDSGVVLMIFMGTLIVAFILHRIAKHSPLRNVFPNWESWNRGKHFPMGFALGPAFAIYLALGTLHGTGAV